MLISLLLLFSLSHVTCAHGMKEDKYDAPDTTVNFNTDFYAPQSNNSIYNKLQETGIAIGRTLYKHPIAYTSILGASAVASTVGAYYSLKNHNVYAAVASGIGMLFTLGSISPGVFARKSDIASTEKDLTNSLKTINRLVNNIDSSLYQCKKEFESCKKEFESCKEKFESEDTDINKSIKCIDDNTTHITNNTSNIYNNTKKINAEAETLNITIAKHNAAELSNLHERVYGDIPKTLDYFEKEIQQNNTTSTWSELENTVITFDFENITNLYNCFSTHADCIIHNTHLKESKIFICNNIYTRNLSYITSFNNQSVELSNRIRQNTGERLSVHLSINELLRNNLQTTGKTITELRKEINSIKTEYINSIKKKIQTIITITKKTKPNKKIGILRQSYSNYVFYMNTLASQYANLIPLGIRIAKSIFSIIKNMNTSNNCYTYLNKLNKCYKKYDTTNDNIDNTIRTSFSTPMQALFKKKLDKLSGYDLALAANKLTLEQLEKSNINITNPISINIQQFQNQFNQKVINAVNNNKYFYCDTKKHYDKLSQALLILKDSLQKSPDSIYTSIKKFFISTADIIKNTTCLKLYGLDTLIPWFILYKARYIDHSFTTFTEQYTRLPQVHNQPYAGKGISKTSQQPSCQYSAYTRTGGTHENEDFISTIYLPNANYTLYSIFDGYNEAKSLTSSSVIGSLALAYFLNKKLAKSNSVESIQDVMPLVQQYMNNIYKKNGDGFWCSGSNIVFALKNSNNNFYCFNHGDALAYFIPDNKDVFNIDEKFKSNSQITEKTTSFLDTNNNKIILLGHPINDHLRSALFSSDCIKNGAALVCGGLGSGALDFKNTVQTIQLFDGIFLRGAPNGFSIPNNTNKGYLILTSDGFENLVNRGRKDPFNHKAIQNNDVACKLGDCLINVLLEYRKNKTNTMNNIVNTLIHQNRETASKIDDISFIIIPIGF